MVVPDKPVCFMNTKTLAKTLGVRLELFNATPEKNKLTTGTLTWSDIHNKAAYEASSFGVAYDSKKYQKTDKKNYKNQGLTPVIGPTVSGKADSTTTSAIALGTIEIKDKANQKQDLSTLSRDSKQSINALGKIFDKQTVEEQQQLIKLFGEVAYDAVGNMKLKEGSPEKAAVDMVVGGIMSQLGGGGFGQGAAAAGLSQLAMTYIMKINDPAIQQWVAALIGAVASDLTGGNGNVGAFIALSQIRNNWQSHGITFPDIHYWKDGKEYVLPGMEGLVTMPGTTLVDPNDPHNSEIFYKYYCINIVPQIADQVGNDQAAIREAYYIWMQNENGLNTVLAHTGDLWGPANLRLGTGTGRITQDPTNSTTVITDSIQHTETYQKVEEKIDLVGHWDKESVPESDRVTIPAPSLDTQVVNGVNTRSFQHEENSKTYQYIIVDDMSAKSESEALDIINKLKPTFFDGKSLDAAYVVIRTNGKAVQYEIPYPDQLDTSKSQVSPNQYQQMLDATTLIGLKSALDFGTEKISDVLRRTSGETIGGSGGPGNAVKLGSNFESHLTTVEGFTQKNGISGGHNETAFSNYFKESNIPINIVSKTQNPAIEGIYNIEYQVGALDYTGKKYVEGAFKNDILKKTVYDSSKISDSQITNWAKEAMNEGISANRIFTQKNGTVVVEGVSNNGLKFRGYKDPMTGDITNAYPYF